MSVSFYHERTDNELFWFWRLKKGKVQPPEPAYVPFEENYDMDALKNILREEWGRHRCPACGRPFFFIRSAWNCHPAASAYKVWNEFANRGAFGGLSTEDSVRLASAVIYRDSFTSGPFDS